MSMFLSSDAGEREQLLYTKRKHPCDVGPGRILSEMREFLVIACTKKFKFAHVYAKLTANERLKALLLL